MRVSIRHYANFGICYASIVAVEIAMKQNAENQPEEAAAQQPDLHVVEPAAPRARAQMFKFPRRERKNRPEIAVLGWNARFYRLSLRPGKA
jgi:hypothetical protein